MTEKVSKSRTKEMLGALCRAYGIEILYVFGSRAKEIQAVLNAGAAVDEDRASDVDIAFKALAKRRLSVRRKAELCIDLEDLLGVDRIDLVALPEADPFLAANVVRGIRLYCADALVADEYELYLLRRAGDLAPFECERTEAVLHR